MSRSELLIKFAEVGAQGNQPVPEEMVAVIAAETRAKHHHFFVGRRHCNGDGPAYCGPYRSDCCILKFGLWGWCPMGRIDCYFRPRHVGGASCHIGAFEPLSVLEDTRGVTFCHV